MKFQMRYGILVSIILLLTNAPVHAANISPDATNSVSYQNRAYAINASLGNANEVRHGIAGNSGVCTPGPTGTAPIILAADVDNPNNYGGEAADEPFVQNMTPIYLLLLKSDETVYENCCIEGICSPLSPLNCQQAGGIPINAPCDPNPCNFGN